jgi:glycosyltransferase involved in cell wall biosynthesis
MDDFPAFHRRRLHIEEDQTAVIKDVDLVQAASQALYDRVCLQARRVRMVPNGVDISIFHRISKEHRPPWDLPLGRPIVGYHGTISEWFDFGLIQEMATKRPNWQITLIGPVLKKIPRTSIPSNVHFLGAKPIGQLPSYLSFFDVAIIPFKHTPVAFHSNPIKAYEYLAMGLPVVSPPIKELLRYRHVVHLAWDREDFLISVDNFLRDPGSDEKVQERIKVAQRCTWNHVFNKVNDILSEFEL